MSSEPFVWFITGCSSGLGRELTLAALKRGDKVIATTRAGSFESIKDLKQHGADILELDVNAHTDKLKNVAEEAIKLHGHVDVLMNNAGFLMSGSLEETTSEDMITQFNTNFFGAMNVSRAFLPYMRGRKKGIIAFIGSIFGWSPGPFGGAYAASKFALRGMAESLHQEISPFGLHSICFDFGFFRTEVLDKLTTFTPIIEDYKKDEEGHFAMLAGFSGNQPGDPIKAVNVIIDVLKSEGAAKGKKIPVNLLMGADCYETVKARCVNTLKSLEDWKHITCSTNFTN